MFLKMTSYDEFANAVETAGNTGITLVPVVAECLSDFITPVSAYRALRENISPLSLLESVVQGRQGRYSIIAIDPFLRFMVKNGISTEESFNEFATCALMMYDFPAMSFYSRQRMTAAKTSKKPLKHLNALLQRYSPMKVPDLDCFTGGAIGYFGYEAVNLIEPAASKHQIDDLDCPDIYLYFFNKVVIFDHIDKTIKIVVNVMPSNGVNLINTRNMAIREIKKIKARLDKGCGESRAYWSRIKPADTEANMSREDFISMVKKAKEYIASGDIFQVVLSQRFSREFMPYDVFDFYRLLRHTNPSPYMFLLEFEEKFSIVGASPEVMVSIRNEKMLSRPIAGTRKRGQTEKEDEELARDLSTDEKELAEHKMLVDLARNDVGRFAKIGTVNTEGMLRVEYYSHVMHLASDVTGLLRDDVMPFEACLGSLPAGTLSGAPKIRAMEIINELEPSCRGPYGGMVGWITEKSLDSCIFIRSALVKNGRIYWQTGAGIVADSIPESEYEETIIKARALERVLKLMEKRRRK